MPDTFTTITNVINSPPGQLAAGSVLKVVGYEFQYICNIEPVRDIYGSVRRNMPQERYRNRRNLPLNRYGEGPFCKFTIGNRFQAVSGVYVLTVNGEVRYVGECASLSARFNSGYGNISPRNCF